jgi:hypothetical protein
MPLAAKFPPFYSCSVCECAVKVTLVPNAEPLKHFTCGHDGAIVYANPKVILRGVGKIGMLQGASFKIRVKISQLLTWLTGRSI